MRSKIVIIIVALALGGLAAVLAANYLRSARADIASETENVTVLVAKEDLPRGLTAQELVDRGLVVEEEMPRLYVAEDAISSPRVVEEQVLAVPVSKGEQLTKTRFQYPAQAGLGYSVPENQVALTIDVDAVTGVAGLLKPGDDVVVYATYEPENKLEQAVTITQIAKARVLAVGAQVTVEDTSAQSEEQGEGVLAANRTAANAESMYQTVTLALSVAEAQSVVFAREEGKVHLALLPQNADAPDIPLPTWFGKPEYDGYDPALP